MNGEANEIQADSTHVSVLQINPCALKAIHLLLDGLSQCLGGAAKEDGVLHCVVVCVCGEAYVKLPTQAIFPVYLLDFFCRLTCANVKALCADFL